MGFYGSIWFETLIPFNWLNYILYLNKKIVIKPVNETTRTDSVCFECIEIKRVQLGITDIPNRAELIFWFNSNSKTISNQTGGRIPSHLGQCPILAVSVMFLNFALFFSLLGLPCPQYTHLHSTAWYMKECDAVLVLGVDLPDWKMWRLGSWWFCQVQSFVGGPAKRA